MRPDGFSTWEAGTGGTPDSFDRGGYRATNATHSLGREGTP